MSDTVKIAYGQCVALNNQLQEEVERLGEMVENLVSSNELLVLRNKELETQLKQKSNIISVLERQLAEK